MDAIALGLWQDTSAYFNGRSVTMTLTVPPGEKGAISVEAVLTTDLAKTSTAAPKSPAGVSAIIGNDERVPSTDPRSGRIMPTGCTGWLASIGVGLTAGHCFADPSSAPALIEFNVPPSKSDGTPVHPGPQDQYPIGKNVKWISNSYGDDWGVFPISANTSTGRSVFAAQGFYRISANLIPFYQQVPTDMISVQITGYGTDATPPGSTGSNNAQSQTEQTAIGPIVTDVINPPANLLVYAVDTMPGNSGSPVYYPATDIAVAIHASNCNALKPNTNCGTLFTNTGLTNALQTYYGTTAVFVDADTFPAKTPDGTVYNPYPRLELAVSQSPAGSDLFLVKGHYAGYKINFPNKKLVLHAVAGGVSIGALNPTP